MNDQLDSLLTRLPDPVPPSAFKAAVMARIAREADRPQPDPAVVRAQQRRDWRAWILAPTGLLVAAGALAYPYLVAQIVPDLSVRTSPVSAGLMPAGSPVLLAAAGLLLYLAGLFGTLRGGGSLTDARNRRHSA